MKKLLIFLFSTIIFFGCKKNQEPEITPINVNISAKYASAELGKVLSLSQVRIELKNINTNKSNIVETDVNGNVSLANIALGIYDINASIEIKAADYTKLTGEIVSENVVFNASQKSKALTLSNAGNIELSLVSGIIGNWLIKQIHYAGSNTTTGASFRDQFIEIYNNTDSVLYADSLFIGEIIGRQSFTNTGYNTLPNGQYDWSKSLGMPSNIDANNSYVYPRALLMIPGNGKQYRVQPGKSFIIAQTALNHKSPFTGNDGKSITVRDPSLTVDLSGAEFEAYYASFLAKPLASDIDNPQVPNVEVLSYFGTDLILDALGRTGVILFKGNGITQVKSLPQYNFPTVAPPSSSADKYFQIPNALIIDAVELQPNTAAARIPKKLGASLDAGFTYAPNGSYSSQSVIRKTLRTDNNRIILKDTNNSTEDFDYFTLANPRGFKQ
ncbi:hypothetical protein ASE92_20420 [Pedobacter sp. Leaf41]|uniref:DUF4876 domain-containing protein n=1 Tax=Pedobacter sp. Leaf41 TaxID=1736218 RepID=UPI000702C2ED|nr:DUF4876 domain-containing protein [Pedobacter sp. Leaf41]KQN36773.1 hypothetical protein ASE92_20420 [Pedobacter sp. Leaf41]